MNFEEFLAQQTQPNWVGSPSVNPNFFPEGISERDKAAYFVTKTKRDLEEINKNTLFKFGKIWESLNKNLKFELTIHEYELLKYDCPEAYLEVEEILK
jgi:hypothetical protein